MSRVVKYETFEKMTPKQLMYGYETRADGTVLVHDKKYAEGRMAVLRKVAAAARGSF